MAKKIKNKAKKELRTYIIQTLEKTFGKLREGMSEKKFNRNIKKAGKLMVVDFRFDKPKKNKIPETLHTTAE